MSLRKYINWQDSYLVALALCNQVCSITTIRRCLCDYTGPISFHDLLSEPIFVVCLSGRRLLIV